MQYRAYFSTILLLFQFVKTKMFYMTILFLLIFLPFYACDTPYLLRTFPTESVVDSTWYKTGPCMDPIKTLSFLKGNDNASLEHSECVYDESDSILTCKLSILNASETLDLNKYPLDDVKVLILFVQESVEHGTINRVLDLCFLDRFGSALEELAICGYSPPVSENFNYTQLHMLDVPALAIFKSKIQTLLICSVDIWQVVELRQLSSLKHLIILQGETRTMRYYHSPFCADCNGAHPLSLFSFHYLIPLSSQLKYFLYGSPYSYEPCSYDLLKKIKANPKSISTFVVASSTFATDESKPICDTCASGLCPLLSVCLEKDAPNRRKPKEPFECLCVEDVDVEDEFQPCDSMTIHEPMYSSRCNHTPSFWNYVTLAIMIFAGYILASIIVFICSTIFLLKSKQS